MNQLASILKKARQALDLTQEDVAKKLGISQRAYAFYEDENLERMPRAKRLEDLAKVLNIPVKTVLKYYNGGLEEETTIAEHNSQSDTPLPGHATLQDHIELYKRWLADKETKYQDSHNANMKLLELLNNKLTEIEANLKTGHHEIKEQIFVSTDALAQQLEGISSGLAAQAKDREASKTGKDTSGRGARTDGKGKIH